MGDRVLPLGTERGLDVIPAVLETVQSPAKQGTVSPAAEASWCFKNTCRHCGGTPQIDASVLINQGTLINQWPSATDFEQGGHGVLALRPRPWP